ncbi:MAG TPA: hypothetical protein VLD65_02615 [Anaerolineales bacterium]|nr:hypothetical protein [Anaerolineales bacterium]
MAPSSQTSRYGFYYFPDSIHYRDSDLSTWLPHLQDMGVSWLTLLASPERAIPEAFIGQIIEAGIHPVIHLPLPISGDEIASKVTIFFEAYAHWGAQYIALFDRPNQMDNWAPDAWAQKNLVERFLEKFIPVAEAALREGLIPIFPPLEPGGDYWDTAFLFSALQGLQRRGLTDLLDRLVLSAYAWSGNRSINWGAGGPERWPGARPYVTSQNSEDQMGFRIFDWYLATAEAALGKTLPILLLGAGSRMGDQPDPQSPAIDIQSHAWQNMALVKLMSGQAKEYDPVPPEVLTCNFWVLSAASTDPEVNNAWLKPNLDQLPVVTMLKEWVDNNGVTSSHTPKSKSTYVSKLNNPKPIAHYLLLPTFEWGSVDWQLENIRPFITKYQPTIGFSAVEASHAKKVTVIGGATSIPESIIDGLLAAGCVVEQISGDGMNIASHLSSRPSD